MLILLFAENNESSKLLVSITSTLWVSPYPLRGLSLLEIPTSSKNSSTLLKIWYLVNILDLFFDFDGNGSTFDNCLLVNSLGFFYRKIVIQIIPQYY